MTLLSKYQNDFGLLNCQYIKPINRKIMRSIFLVIQMLDVPRIFYLVGVGWEYPHTKGCGQNLGLNLFPDFRSHH